MRSSYEDDWPSSWNFPTASGMNLSKEEIQNDGKDPEKDVITKVGHSMLFLVVSWIRDMIVNLILGGRHDGFLRRTHSSAWHREGKQNDFS